MTITYAKRLRVDRGEGQVQAARAAGVSFTTLKKVEAGLEVNAVSLEKLAEHYGVPASHLLPGGEPQANGAAA